jgi:hypothetical protein
MQSKQAEQRERELARQAGRKPQPLTSPFSTQIAGVSFVEQYPKTLLDMQELRMAEPSTMWLKLRRNPKNQYDSNAIEVHWDGHMIGHINKVVAARLAPELDAGVEWLCRVEDIVGDDDIVGCTIRLKRGE